MSVVWIECRTPRSYKGIRLGRPEFPRILAGDCLKTLELPNQRPYELLKRDTEGLFLQCCIAKNVRSRGHQTTFQTVSATANPTIANATHTRGS